MPYSNKFFKIDGKLNYQQLNQTVSHYLVKYGLNKSNSLLGHSKYALTEKQRAFIEFAYEEFFNLYDDLYKFYQDGTQLNIVESLKAMLDRRFALQRNNFLLGQTTAETSGFGRFIAAIYFLIKDEKKKNKDAAIKDELKAIKPSIDFLGSPEQARVLFVKFLLRVAIRFQNSIELLANNEEGLQNLAHFVSNICFEKIITKNSINLEAYNSFQGKITYLLALSSKEDKDFLKFWAQKKLKIENIDSITWTIKGLLYRSPIEYSEISSISEMPMSHISTYSGTGEEKGLSYPTKIYTTEEAQVIPCYSKLKMY